MVQNRDQKGSNPMNSGSLPSGTPLAPVAQPDWPRKIEAWRQLLAQCCRKPSRKCVHGLRVATLRLQVELEHGLRERPRDDAGARAARRWNRQGKKLRRALQPVREADVFLGKLASLRGPAAVAGKEMPQPGRRLRQVVELEQRLRKRRQTAAKKLVAAIKDRRERLDRLSKGMEAALGPQMPRAMGPAEGTISGLIAGLVSEFPELNGDNLHEYRKRIKRVHYLAELLAAADPRATQQATVLKKMQVAVGEWHDWEALAERAGRVPGKHDFQDGLVELLETLTAASLEKALRQCRRSTARLLKHDRVNETSPMALPPKLSVVRVEAPVAEKQIRYA